MQKSIHKMKLSVGPLKSIDSNTKTIEIRLYSEKRQKNKFGRY